MNNNSATMFWIVFLLGMVGPGDMDENSTTPGPLRKSLHGPTAGVAPATLEQAMTISESTGASHFQKLPGKKRRRKEKPFYHFAVIVLVIVHFSPLQRGRTNWQGMPILSSSFP